MADILINFVGTDGGEPLLWRGYSSHVPRVGEHVQLGWLTTVHVHTVLDVVYCLEGHARAEDGHLVGVVITLGPAQEAGCPHVLDRPLE